MKVSLSWLKDLVEIPFEIEELSESLSMSGFEVEETIDLSKSFDGIVTGYVKDIKKHPNANKLKICSVEIGEEKPIQIVCGASNVKERVHVLVALEGAYLSAIDLRNNRISISEAKRQIIEFEGKKPPSLKLFLEYVVACKC